MDLPRPMIARTARVISILIMALCGGCSDADTEALVTSSVNVETDATQAPRPELEALAQLFRDKKFDQFYPRFVALKEGYPQDRTLLSFEHMIREALQRNQKPPLRIPDLDFATQLEWQLIDKDYSALDGSVPIEAAQASIPILARVNLLLERVPNFWEGRVLQAHLALGLGENASGRAAVSWMQSWDSLEQYDPATIEAFRRRGWLVEAPNEQPSPETVEGGDYAAQLEAMLQSGTPAKKPTDRANSTATDSRYVGQLAALLAQSPDESKPEAPEIPDDLEIEIKVRLSKIAAAAAEYMLEHGVESVGYKALMSGTDYLDPADFEPLAGEDYSTVFPIRLDQALSISLPKSKQTITFSY